jgi:hypothetical protein
VTAGAEPVDIWADIDAIAADMAQW